MDEQAKNVIRSKDSPLCKGCGKEGLLVYAELKDLLFGAPGLWGVRKCPSEHCGLMWPDPMPLEEEIGKAYKNYYTHEKYRVAIEKNDMGILRRFYNITKTSYLAYRYGYDQTHFGGLQSILGRLIQLIPSRRVYLDSSVYFLRANPGGRLLEVGCGSGETLMHMLKLGWQAEGVDFDPAAVDCARSKGLNVSLGSLEQQEYPDNHFDAVVMSHLIEHVHDPLLLVKESRRVLKPGGNLVILTPNNRSFGHKLFREEWRGLEPPRHLNIFCRMSLCNLVKIAGFKRLTVSSTIRNANFIFIASWAYKKDNKYIEGRPQPFAIRLIASLLQYIEWVFLKCGFDLGEEIALVAIK